MFQVKFHVTGENFVIDKMKQFIDKRRLKIPLNRSHHDMVIRVFIFDISLCTLKMKRISNLIFHIMMNFSSVDVYYKRK